MWQTIEEKINNGKRFTIKSDLMPITYMEVLNLWQFDADFRECYTSSLANSDFTSYRWETPPISIASINQPFEYVLLDSPSLNREADSSAFSEFIENCGASNVVEFQNLRKDARMIVPCESEPSANYCHLGSFLRSAPNEQIHDLWKLIGKVAQEEIGQSPRWLSTAGAGVPWLHVRLDSTPKYYGYGKYRQSV
jgi:hypothetical protein